MNIRTEAVHQLRSHPLELPPAPLCPPLAALLLFSGLTARLSSGDSSVARLLQLIWPRQANASHSTRVQSKCDPGSLEMRYKRGLYRSEHS